MMYVSPRKKDPSKTGKWVKSHFRRSTTRNASSMHASAQSARFASILAMKNACDRSFVHEASVRTCCRCIRSR